MQPNETVNEYYHKIFKLWQQANTSDDQCIKKFKPTLKSFILTLLLAFKHNSLRKLFNAAQLVKKKKKKISSIFFGNLMAARVISTVNNTAAMMTANIPTSDRFGNLFNLNARFIPIATKPQR